MKKAAKGIIALSATLAVLGGGYAALVLTDNSGDKGGETSVSETDPTEGEQQVKILIRDDKVTGTDPETGADLEGVVKTVDVTNKTDVLHVVQKSAKTDESAATYTLQGCEDLPMNTSVIGTLANNANGLTSEAIIEENCTDLGKFGLASPEITVDVTYETGTKCRMLIGDKAPTGDATYVMIDGLNTVFTVRNSALANYSKTLFDFVESTIIEEPDPFPTINKVTVHREDMEKDLVLEYDKWNDDADYRGGTSSSHIMTSPTTAYLGVERSTDIVSGMFGLRSAAVYAIHCKDTDIAEAGLSEPFCTVSVDCSDNTSMDILFSEPFTDTENGKCCYTMIDGGKIIYTVTLEDAKWVTVQPVDIASRIFIASYIWNVSDLTVKCDGSEYKFNMKQKNPGEKLDSPQSDDYDTALNGETFDTERFRQFYSFLIGANAESFALDEKKPAGAPMAEVYFKDSYTGEEQNIEFYDCNVMSALIVINGESKFYISKSFVEALKENAANLKSDTDFRTTW